VQAPAPGATAAQQRAARSARKRVEEARSELHATRAAAARKIRAERRARERRRADARRRAQAAARARARHDRHIQLRYGLHGHRHSRLTGRHCHRHRHVYFVRGKRIVLVHSHCHTHVADRRR
jgi:hypothetical protein